jgi:pyruvate formate lyase activating enzyme
MAAERRRPLIFDIHRYALDDGPGIRTTVFFKGCPLACIWCHNPEGMRSGPELYHQAQNCIGCTDCVGVCPQGAITLNGGVQIDRRRCNVCGQCAALCPGKAMTIKGRYYEPHELVEILLQDQRFFHHSKGGVTFSGGEPTQHPLYLNQVVRLLKHQGIHVALQTCGHFQWDLLQGELLPWVDLIYFDIKCLDPHRHRQWTGQSNRTILNNFSKLVETARDKLVCTIPLIKGWTAEKKLLQAAAHTIGGIDRLKYCLRPYHPGAMVKTAALGKAHASGLPAQAMAPDEYRQIAVTFDTLVRNHRKRR